jgi:hypothetical protein
MKSGARFVIALVLFGRTGCWPTAWAAPTEDLARIQKLLAIPQSLAKVTAAWWPQPLGPHESSSIQTLPNYVLIQDVHRHPQVQGQVSSLIVQGYEQWGVRKVFLEGAFTPLDVSVFHRIPQNTRRLLLERLVHDGDLSGPELAAVTIMEKEWRNPPVSTFQLYGLEDPELYRESIHAYQTVMALRDRALNELVTMRRWQENMDLPTPNVLSEQLNRIDALLRLKLTPAEHDAYLKTKEALPAWVNMDKAIQAAEEFYRLVHLRSEYYLRQVEKIAPAGSGTRIVVVGGFHTPYMAEGLKKEGRTFVVLAPAVSQSLTEPLYEKRMQQTATTLMEPPIPASR